MKPRTLAHFHSRARGLAHFGSRARGLAHFGSRARGLASTLLLISLMAFPGSVIAQPVDSLLLAPDQSGFTGFAASRTPGHLGVDGTLWLDYALHPLEGRDLNVRGMPLRQRVDGTAIVQLGLWSRLALAVRLPFVLAQEGDVGMRRAGVGNPALDGRVRVHGAGVRPDGTVRDGLALSLRGVVHLPTASERRYIAEDRVRLDVSATLDVELFGILVGGAFSWRVNQWSEPTPRGAFAEELRFDGGVRVPVQLLSRRYPGKLLEGILIEVGVGHFRAQPFEARFTPGEARLGYRVAVSDYFSTLALGAGFNDSFGNPDLRVLLGLGYSPRKHDQDADGIPDHSDGCVHLPEDRDGYQDQDGCPDDDNDGDMIVDEDDRCPLVPAEWGKDDDEDGCTDGS